MSPWSNERLHCWHYGHHRAASEHPFECREHEDERLPICQFLIKIHQPPTWLDSLFIRKFSSLTFFCSSAVTRWAKVCVSLPEAPSIPLQLSDWDRRERNGYKPSPGALINIYRHLTMTYPRPSTFKLQKCKWGAVCILSSKDGIFSHTTLLVEGCSSSRNVSFQCCPGMSL